MNKLSPRTRAVFDALRESESVSSAQIDRAWRRFARTEIPPPRSVAARWIAVAGVGAAIGIIALLAGSLSGSTVQPGSQAEPHEAAAHAESGEPAREATPHEAMLGTKDDGEVERSPEPVDSPPSLRDDDVQPRDRDAPPRERPRTRTEREPASPQSDEPASRATSTLAAELRLLDDAERALRTGRLDRVDELLAAHRERYPDGVLREERDKLAAELARQR